MDAGRSTQVRWGPIVLAVVGGLLTGALIIGVVAVLVFRKPSTTEAVTLSVPATSSPPASPGTAGKPKVRAGSGELTKLVVTTLIEGTGAKVSAGQTLTVQYVGVYYKTGAEFDSSWRRDTPYTFVLSDQMVIKGWAYGLVGVRVGSQVQLDIPADLAYGNDPSTGPAGPLRFVVDVISAS